MGQFSAGKVGQFSAGIYTYHGTADLPHKIMPQQLDVGVVELLQPIGTMYQGTMVNPSIIIQNYGSTTGLFPVILNIGAFYTDTVMVSALIGARDTIVFDVWLVTLGTHNVVTYTVLSGDQNLSNDTISSNFIVIPHPYISINDVGVPEGHFATSNANFEVWLSNISTETVIVDFMTSDGSATTSDNDYIESSGSLAFNPGDTLKTISIPVVGDTKIEPNESFYVILSSPTNALFADSIGSCTIINDDAAQGLEYLTYTQEFYGNSNNLECLLGRTSLDLINDLITFDDLVVGRPNYSLRLRQAYASDDATCVVTRLPAEGPPRKLPRGNVVFNPRCGTTPGLGLKNGRFKNILLCQTIALGLNLRLDPNLGNLIITDNYMTTQASNYVNGVCMDGNDILDTNKLPESFYIPQSVLTAMNSLYGNTTVANLFDLANRALGNASIGGATISEINAAVSAINEGFDKARFLIGFSSTPPSGAVLISDKQILENPLQFLLSDNYPNPFNPNTIIEYGLPVDAQVRVCIFNVLGEEVKTLVNGIQDAGYKSVEWDATNNQEQGVTSGIYFYRIEAIGLSENAQSFRQVKKMILMK